VAAAAVIAALAAGGYFVGHSGGGKASTPSSNGISVEKATVGIPSGWHELKSVPTIPNLPLKDAVGTAPNGSSGLVMGTANLTYPWLLPRSVIGHQVALKKTAYNSRPFLVGIGGLQAYRSSGRSFDASGKPLYTFIYFPQGKRATTMAVCYSNTGSVAKLLDCEKVAGGIKISGAKVYDLVPSSSYASSLSSALSSLSKSAQSGSKALSSAKTSAAQAKAARQIAAAYTSGANAVKKLDATPYAQPANQDVYKALVTTAGAYRTLASAASAKSSSRYAAAKKNIASAENDVSSALSELKELGYSTS
jgi:hypothetical protein